MYFLRRQTLTLFAINSICLEPMVTMMVRLFAVALGLSAALGSFELDLIYRAPLRNNLRDRKSLLQKELLNKAKPLHEYYRDMGIDMSTQTHRALDQNYAETVYSFSGYSLKYAKCQPVQYFSDRAIRNGEHTPIALEDIVILRLCPQSSCISKQEYGCHYNYAEYAIDVSDYLKIMLQYSSDRTDALCNYCSECLANGQGGGNRKQRKVQEEYNDDQLNDDGQEEENDYAEDEQAQENGYADDAGNYGENQYANVAQNGYYDEYANACDGWNTYCSDYANMCSDNNNNYESVANYLDCAQVDYNYYSYFVRPRCDGTSNTIKMAIYYDKYCIQYAGNEVPVSYLNLGFKESMFKEYYNGTCMDCSDDESVSHTTVVCSITFYTCLLSALFHRPIAHITAWTTPCATTYIVRRHSVPTISPMICSKINRITPVSARSSKVSDSVHTTSKVALHHRRRPTEVVARVRKFLLIKRFYWFSPWLYALV